MASETSRSSPYHVDDYIQFAEDLQSRVLKLQNVSGIGKLDKKLKAELKFMKSLKRRDLHTQQSRLKSSNLGHFASLVHASERLPGLVGVLVPFGLPSRSDSLLVDLLAAGGHAWVKVVARKAQALHLVWAGAGQFGERDLLSQAEEYLKCAARHPHNFRTPQVHFAFYNQVTLPMAAALETLGIHVWGVRVPIETDVLTKLEGLEVSDSSDDDSGDDYFTLYNDQLLHVDESDIPLKDAKPCDDVLPKSFSQACNFTSPKGFANSQDGQSHTRLNENTHGRVHGDTSVSSLSELEKETSTFHVSHLSSSHSVGACQNTKTIQQPNVFQDLHVSVKDEKHSLHYITTTSSVTLINQGEHVASNVAININLSYNNTEDHGRLLLESKTTDLTYTISRKGEKLSSEFVENEAQLLNYEPQNLCQAGCGESPNHDKGSLFLELVVSPPDFTSFVTSLQLIASRSVVNADSVDRFVQLETPGRQPSLANADGEMSHETAPQMCSAEVKLGDIQRVNLDITSLIALVSSVTNGKCNLIFKDQVLTTQAREEREEPILPVLKQFLAGKELFACETAVASFRSILNILGGPEENARATKLLAGVTIVPDDPSPRTLGLECQGRIKERSKIVFGTGDTLQAVTVTSNTGFIRAARSQGIVFPVFLHAARALTEEKEENATLLPASS